MSYFSSEQEVYDHVGRLFVDVLADEELGPRFCAADTVVRYEHHDPEATITVSLPCGEPPQVEFGEGSLVPEVTMRMAADVAHRFWLGQVNVAVALTRGEIQAQGPVEKLLWLVPLTAPAIPLYKRQLAEQGREDLIALRPAAVA